MKNHTLINTLTSLRGNPRGCVYTEPLWGIPFNLYAPYISVFMIAIGLTDQQVGLIASISLGAQIFMMLLSGVVTDKLGRRRTTLIFDIVSWSIPALISGIAQNFWYFLIAGLLNSVYRITQNSWTCLLVEDADQDQLVDIYAWIYIANQIVGFAAPLAGVLIGVFSMVPTVRGLYFFAAFMFTVKAMVTYRMTHETQQGLVRLHETRHQSPLSVLKEYRGVFLSVLHTPETLYTAAILLITQITMTINGSFWSVIVTKKLLIPPQNLAIFPFVKSTIMLIFFFSVIPLINRIHFKTPLVIGFLGYVASQLLLITAPVGSYLFLISSVFLEACSFATVSPLIDKLTVLTVDAKERARILSILYVGIILITSPFGWIAGTLSQLNRGLPFILNIILFILGAGLAYHIGTLSLNRQAAEEQAASTQVVDLS